MLDFDSYEVHESELTFKLFKQVEAVQLVADGKAPKIPQSEEGASYEGIQKKSNAKVRHKDNYVNRSKLSLGFSKVSKEGPGSEDHFICLCLSFSRWIWLSQQRSSITGSVVMIKFQVPGLSLMERCIF